MPRTLSMHARHASLAARIALGGASGLLVPAALAQTPPDYGFSFATVGAVNNPAFTDTIYPFGSPVVGRGSVSYEYRISKSEISTAQWVEFLNTFASAAKPHPFWNVDGPVFWGAQQDTPIPFRHYALVPWYPNAGQLPVGGITWHMAALYCNWLNNGKSSDPNSLITGAYDTRTWGYTGGPRNPFTDDPHHLSTATFWIPTLDESLKAMHYDKDRYGPGQGGWWRSMNKSDAPGTSGLPGVGTTSAGVTDPSDPFFAWHIPLGSYPQSQSPWGLLDTSGGTEEWTEETVGVPDLFARLTIGSFAGNTGFRLSDDIESLGGGGPDNAFSTTGFRIASIVPAPATSVVLVGVAFLSRRRRR